jgi:hypothetical protein
VYRKLHPYRGTGRELAGAMPSYLEGASVSPREGGAMNRGEPPSTVSPSKGLLWRARPPGGKTFQFQTFILAPSLEIWVKIFSCEEGCSRGRGWPVWATSFEKMSAA